MPLPVTLYTVSAVVVLDTSGNRIFAKYYDHAVEFVNSNRKQEAFEKGIHDKTRKQSSKAKFNQRETSNDLIICVVGRGEDSTELMLVGAVDVIHEALSEIIKPQLDKKSVLEHFDLLVLTIDEVIDRGVIMETEGLELAQRISQSLKPEGSGSSSLSELREQTLSSAFNFAKQHIARTILKQ